MHLCPTPTSASTQTLPCVILYMTVMDELVKGIQVELFKLLDCWLTFGILTQVLKVLQWERLSLLGSCSSRNKIDSLPKFPFLGIPNYRWVLTWLSAIKSSFNYIYYCTAIKYWARI